MSQNHTIFVQIPSYRDHDCVRTVENMFANAAYPDRVFVGICWQYKPDAGEVPLNFSDRQKQIRIINVDAKESKGVGWAKHQAQSLWQNEDYILQIDSHTRFIEGWDEALLEELAKCDAPKAVLTAPPPGFTLAGGINDNARPTFRVPVRFDTNGLLRLTSDPFDVIPSTPLKTAFVSSRFIFAASALIQEVPNDPYIYWDEEETTLSARIWTHGWDIYTPGKLFVYHLYNSDGKQRPLHWKDNTNWSNLRAASLQRYPYVMGLEQPQADSDAADEWATYSVGTERSIQDYTQFCGVDFHLRSPIANANECDFMRQVKGAKSQSDYWLKPVDSSAVNTHQKTSGRQPIISPVAKGDVVKTAKLKAKPAPASALTIGDFVPFFDLNDHRGELRELQLYAGKNIILYFLPATDKAYLHAFFDLLDAKQEKYLNAELQKVIIVPASVKELASWGKQYRTACTLWSDEDKAVHRLFGLENATEPVSFLLDANLKIAQCYDSSQVKDHVNSPLMDCKKLPLAKKPKMLTRHAPVMIVPNVIDAALCERIIRYWKEGGKQYEGTVGIGDGRQVKRNVKSRTDVDVRDKTLLADIDNALVKSAFPEIRKVGSTEIEYREVYKIGCYKSDEQGHYSKHRDTSSLSLAHRRYSMSICLNDEYEGGGLNFPEYGADIYKPKPGDALIFPSTLMHKVEPVTSGERFVMVSFLYDEAGAAFKCDTIEKQTGKAFTDDENHIVRSLALTGVKESKVYTQALYGSSAVFQPNALAIITSGGGDQPLIKTTEKRELNILKDVPPGVLAITNYLDQASCKVFTDYADKMAGRRLEVLDNSTSTSGATKTKQSDSRITDYVSIDGIVDQALPLFINIYDNVLSSFYGVNFEWFERPQILRYPAGGKYGQHADAEHYDKQQDAWIRAQDRDYSILVYLNEEYGGGELELNSFNFSIKPTTGMLLAFPSDHRYLHTAHPTTSGLRYAMVSWAAAVGTPRVKDRAPYAATYLKLKA